MKFFSPVTIPPPARKVSLQDRILLLGSCFADSVGEKMAAGGFCVNVNPFGTLYNPESIARAIRMLDSDSLFGPADCVEMGAGAGRTCSFMHHTSFARKTAEEFLQNANDKLLKAREFWKTCNVLILSLGTSFVWYHDGSAVANCLKRPAKEFTRRMLSSEESSRLLEEIASAHPEKHLILTVSPIRHLGDGARANALSKASLLLAAEALVNKALVARETVSDFGPYEQERAVPLATNTNSAENCFGLCDYFPAFEIMMDELRDYRFYSEDLVHPTPAAVSFIWDRFLDSFVEPSDLDPIRTNEKASRQVAHRPLAKD